eukprot:4997083-Prymnesium_polylepis.3
MHRPHRPPIPDCVCVLYSVCEIHGHASRIGITSNRQFRRTFLATGAVARAETRPLAVLRASVHLASDCFLFAHLQARPHDLSRLTPAPSALLSLRFPAHAPQSRRRAKPPSLRRLAQQP